MRTIERTMVLMVMINYGYHWYHTVSWFRLKIVHHLNICCCRTSRSINRICLLRSCGCRSGAAVSGAGDEQSHFQLSQSQVWFTVCQQWLSSDRRTDGQTGFRYGSGCVMWESRCAQCRAPPGGQCAHMLPSLAATRRPTFPLSQLPLSLSHFSWPNR